MSLEQPNALDAIGVDRQSGSVVLTLMDSWDWLDSSKHSEALEAKLDVYFAFVESGEVFETYPDAKGRRVVIDVITRFPLSAVGKSIMERAATVGRTLGIAVTSRQVP